MIPNLLQQIQPFLEYDPETNWSIVDYHEQHLLQSIVSNIPEEDLSIGRALRTARLPSTPSRIQWVKHLIVKRFR